MKKPMLLVVLLLASGVARHPAPVDAAPFLPVFDPGDFVADQPVDNPYFPLNSSGTRIFEAEGVDEEGEAFTERFELTNLGTGPEILGVQTTVRRDRAFEDDLLVEDTFDFYAQDRYGNVWYMGEDVTNYIYDADGNLLETNNESAWRAGANGALPGWIMPVDQTLGFNYYQEYAPLDGALDEAVTHATNLFVALAVGEFESVVRVLETNPDGDLEFKYYAPGVGLILAEEGLDASLGNPELRFELVGASPVPEPATMLLVGFGLLGIVGVVRRGSRR